MTRDEAKQALEKTWCFEQVGGKISLRDATLIEAVLAYQTERLEHSPASVHYPEGASLRPN
jgi:hypothetical protein